MKVRRIIYATFFVELFALGAMAATTTVLRPPCHKGSKAYLLAVNSGAVISIDEHDDKTGGNAVVVFRPRKSRGWASQHLLTRFDLDVELNDNQVTVRNSGATCPAAKS